MRIELTPTQREQIVADGCLVVVIDDLHDIYIDYRSGDDSTRNELCAEYVEVEQRNRIGEPMSLRATATEFQKLRPMKPHDPSFYHNDPLCPHCGLYLIYNFECCPKCGQAIDWRERTWFYPDKILDCRPDGHR